MCLKKGFFFFLVVFVFLFCLLDALRAEEQEAWYLISETELRSIEASLERSETDRQSWELQARGLKSEAANLNGQLAEGRKQYKTLEQSFNKYETEKLMQLSLKNGEISDLKEKVATEKLEKEKYKGQATARLIIIIAGAALIVLYIAFKICRFFRLI